MGDWVPNESFAFRLRWVRHEKKLSSRRLAEMIDVSNQAILDWERGASPKNMDEIVLRISRITGVNPVWLMWGKELADELNDQPPQLQTT